MPRAAAVGGAGRIMASLVWGSVMLRILPLLLVLVTPALALEPKDVFVVCNKAAKDSKAVALHYLEQRGVPKDNLIELDLPTSEDITRADFKTKIEEPLRTALKDKKDACKVLLTVYGVPLRVGPVVVSAESKKVIEQIKKEIEDQKKMAEEARSPQEKTVILSTITEMQTKMNVIAGDQSVASVDSELMLLWWPTYEPTRWIMNPLCWIVPEEDKKKAAPTLMTCRLDGPSAAIAMRLVDDAIATEKEGLQGKAYFDARGLKFDIKNKAQYTGYEGYDEGFREAAELMKKAGFDTILDDKEPVFAADSCPDCALYAGWYSHANFIDSGKYNRGSVAWHLASSEAVTLRNKDSKVWCPNLLKKGVCATMGPVAEPYTVAFPKASEFFGFLVTGELTLVECYAKTTILTSWQMVLIGDPLYNPFAKRVKLKLDDIKPSPWGQKK
jgi:uncharacterized protein (TIGR03790 family)